MICLYIIVSTKVFKIWKIRQNMRRKTGTFLNNLELAFSLKCGNGYYYYIVVYCKV